MVARPLFRMLIAAATVAGLLGPPTAAGATTSPPPWDVVPTPNPSDTARLEGVANLSPTDAWAVGWSRPQDQSRTLTEHWDGQRWIVVSSPNPSGASTVRLEGVAAHSSTAVWAVGNAQLTSGATQTLIERWDGTTWTIAPSPNSGTQSKLHDVAVVSATGAWAVGESSAGSIILRWNGSKWKVVANPCPFALFGVTAISANDVWAVGFQHACHWDGRTWSKVNVDPYNITTLVDVSGTSADDVWAVGITTLCPDDCFQNGFIRHWDGSTWMVLLFQDNLFFSGVTALSSNLAYAVGQDCCGRTLILRWNGSRWSMAPNAPVSGSLGDVAASSASDLWAVGSTFSGGPPKTLAERAPSPDSGAVIGNTRVGGATVSWFGPESGSVLSDGFADYVVAGLTPGTYNLFATYPNCDPASATVTISAGVTTRQDLPVNC